MGQLFDDQQRRELKLRLRLDQIEAESEVQRRTDPTAYTFHFGEGFRGDLARLNDFLSLPASELLPVLEKVEEERFSTLMKVLQAFERASPAILQCGSWCTRLGETEETSQTVFIRTGGAVVVDLFTVVPYGYWEESIEVLKIRPETQDSVLVLDMLQRNARSLISTSIVPALTQELSPLAISDALQRWMGRYIPGLAGVPIDWALGEQKQEMNFTHQRYEVLRELDKNPQGIDLLCERLKAALSEDDSDPVS